MTPFLLKITWLAIGGWFAVSCLAGFFLMGIDKSRANYGEWRISERVLLEIALIGGAFGIVAGSMMFHHKTLKFSFVDVAYVAAIAWLATLLGLLRLLGPPTF
jgi:uncharacterized membrane protein YsdA (DUF1294 family)